MNFKEILLVSLFQFSTTFALNCSELKDIFTKEYGLTFKEYMVSIPNYRLFGEEKVFGEETFCTENSDGEITNLDLCFNQEFSPEIIFDIPTLETLKFSFCKLSSLPDKFDNLPNLRKLDIEYTNLSSVPESIFTLKNLENLSFVVNGITSIPDKFDTLPNLKELVLTENEIGTFPDSLFSVKGLEKLDLRYCEIASLNDKLEKIDTFTNLKTLIISGNEYDTLPNAVFKLSNLEDLELHSTKLSSIPDNFIAFPNLKILYINANGLDAVPESIFDLSNLEQLNIGNFNVTSIPDKFNDLPKLKYVSIYRSAITSIPDSLNTLEDLEVVSITDNEDLDAVVLTNPKLVECNYYGSKSVCKPKDNVVCGNSFSLCNDASEPLEPLTDANDTNDEQDEVQKSHVKIINDKETSDEEKKINDEESEVENEKDDNEVPIETVKELKISEDGRCGKDFGVCREGFCCSILGWCGNSETHCKISKGCQSEFGHCIKDAEKYEEENISKDGRCGEGFGRCGKGTCCSRLGWCGTSDAYCGTGCQSKYGQCK